MLLSGSPVKKRILLAEDHDDMTLRQGLRVLGYEITVARDGLAAVEMAISQLPDLIVMDICLPEVDGFQAASLIRKNPQTQAIPIVAVAGKALPGDKEKCKAGGCNAYISKPFVFKELKATIEALLRNGRQ